MSAQSAAVAAEKTPSNKPPPSQQENGKPAPSAAHPPSPSPTTQESFFKSIHKRLQVLESNATLSLQYIEEQSRILRDAFTKVEKRQTGKIDEYIRHLNTTVISELKSFRSEYDQLWQSTVIELETHREQYQREILAVSSRLSILADELVWTRRIAVVQSVLVLTCLALVIFVRSGSGQIEAPLLQHIFNKSHSMLGFNLDSPRDYPSSKEGSPRKGRRLIRIRSADDLEEDSDDARLLSSPSPSPSLSKHNPQERFSQETTQSPSSDREYSPTPSNEPSRSSTRELDSSPISSHLQHLIRPSRSGPATPRGTRDPLSWSRPSFESSPLAASESVPSTPDSLSTLVQGDVFRKADPSLRDVCSSSQLSLDSDAAQSDDVRESIEHDNQALLPTNGTASLGNTDFRPDDGASD